MTGVSRPLAVLDQRHARYLGCAAEDLRSGTLRVVINSHRDIRIARGYPLPVFAMDTGEGCVYSVQPDVKSPAQDALRGALRLDEATTARVERALVNRLSQVEWFHGVRLWLDEERFTDCQSGDIQDISASHESARRLAAVWGGPVFARMMEGKPVAWAVVKALDDTVWDIGCVETDPAHRGRGYARSAASAALKHVFRAGRLACWATDSTNAASLAVASALGFQPYALEHGCFVTG